MHYHYFYICNQVINAGNRCGARKIGERVVIVVHCRQL